MTRWSWVWLIGWWALSSAWCVTAGRELGPTVDEPFYLEAGLKSWHNLHHKELLAAGTMPLPAKAATLPLFTWELWQRRAIELPAQVHEWLPAARRTTLLFWFLLLLGGSLGGRLWGGETAGRLAVAFLAVEPVLLAHASLAATDLAFAACLLLLVVAFKAGRDGPWSKRIGVPASLVALTLLSKASGLVFIPVCLAIVEGEHCWNHWRAGNGLPWRRSLGDLVQIGLGGALLVVLVCPRALRAFRYQIVHNVEGHGLVYLLGQVSPSGFWYYFPAALAIKMSLAVLLLLALFLARPRRLGNGPFLAAVGLIVLSPAYRVQIGVRFLLPVVALAILGLSIALARWLAECRPPFARRLTWAAVACALLWTGAETLRVWPEGLCYTNALFGGSGRGYLALSDSNYDWGQGLPELARWQEQHDFPPLDVWYFGTDPRLEQLPMRRFQATGAHSLEELWQMHRGRCLAVSTSLLYGLEFSSPEATVLRRLTPDGRTPTFLIYDFRAPGSSRGMTDAPLAVR